MDKLDEERLSSGRQRLSSRHLLPGPEQQGRRSHAGQAPFDAELWRTQEKLVHCTAELG